MVYMTEKEKLQHLLRHWIEHNEAHVKTYDEWIARAETMGEQELSDILRQIVEESKKLNGLFKKALDLIE